MDTRQPPFIEIQTKDGLYYINLPKSEETKALAGELENALINRGD
ncbi:MAG: hypothetical protein ACTTKO_04295 [Candidatus Limimorpha sp.]